LSRPLSKPPSLRQRLRRHLRANPNARRRQQPCRLRRSAGGTYPDEPSSALPNHNGLRPFHRCRSIAMRGSAATAGLKSNSSQRPSGPGDRPTLAGWRGRSPVGPPRVYRTRGHHMLRDYRDRPDPVNENRWKYGLL